MTTDKTDGTDKTEKLQNRKRPAPNPSLFIFLSFIFLS